MKKIGIRKTKMNIFWLLVIGLIIGVVVGLRQPMPAQTAPQTTQPINMEAKK